VICNGFTLAEMSILLGIDFQQDRVRVQWHDVFWELGTERNTVMAARFAMAWTGAGPEECRVGLYVALHASGAPYQFQVC
jgi:hypothetical protein